MALIFPVLNHILDSLETIHLIIMRQQILIFIGLLFLVQKFQSQDIKITIGKTNFDNASVLLTNGNTLFGEVQDFNSPNTVEIVGNPFSFTLSATEELEKDLNLDRKKIKFRKTKEDPYRLISADSIDTISFFDEEINKNREFKRLQIVKSVNGNVSVTNRTIFLPVFKKDSINLYGYHLYSNGQYATTIFYLNNPKDNLAVAPYDMRFNEIFAARKKLIERIVSSYKYISGNCPAFHEWLDEQYYSETDKGTRDDYKAIQKDIKNGKKGLKSKEKKQEFEREKWIEFYLKTFTPAIEKYKELCK